MATFYDIWLFIESYSMTDVLLPFLLIFAVIYGIMSKLTMFKGRSSVVISIVMGAIVVIPHVMGKYPQCADVVVIINNALPKIGITVIALLSFLIIAIGIFGMNIGFTGKVMGWAAIIIVGFVAYSFITSRGPGCPSYNTNLFAIPFLDYIIPIAVFIAILWFISRPSGGGQSPPGHDIY